MFFYAYNSNLNIKTEQGVKMITQKMTPISRRQAVQLIGAVSALTLTPKLGLATADSVASRISEVTNSGTISEMDIYLDMPEIAENGNQVKIAFEIDSPMNEAEYVKEVDGDRALGSDVARHIRHRPASVHGRSVTLLPRTASFA